ncbi:MAG: helix-turn-helix domain-containing protein [Ruminococcaceae bacterium]|nr:helix-turn-helix domain-containing protein [Oscillospiraceae bacterium]
MADNMTIYAHIIDGIVFEYRCNEDKAANPAHYPHVHRFCELYFYLAGNCSYMIENGMFQVTPGTVIFTRPGELHSVKINEPCLYERCYFQIHAGAFEFLGADAARETMRCFFDRDFGMGNAAVLSSEMARSCERRIRRTCELLRSGSSDAKSLALAELLVLLHDINVSRDGTNLLNNPTANGLIGDALRYINSNLSELRSTAELASALFVSREYLSRKFSLVMGVSLNRYITVKRVELAKALLQEGASLESVCEKCGWMDYSYFIRVFRQETGMTPMRYRSLKHHP